MMHLITSALHVKSMKIIPPVPMMDWAVKNCFQKLAESKKNPYLWTRSASIWSSVWQSCPLAGGRIWRSWIMTPNQGKEIVIIMLKFPSGSPDNFLVGLVSGGTSSHQNLVPAFPGNNNFLTKWDYLSLSKKSQNGSVTGGWLATLYSWVAAVHTLDYSNTTLERKWIWWWWRGLKIITKLLSPGVYPSRYFCRDKKRQKEREELWKNLEKLEMNHRNICMAIETQKTEITTSWKFSPRLVYSPLQVVQNYLVSAQHMHIM